MSANRRQMGYRVLYFSVLAFLLLATVVVYAYAGWWAAAPALLAVGWVSPLTENIVQRTLKN